MNYSELFITIVAGLTVGAITLAGLRNGLRAIRWRVKKPERELSGKLHWLDSRLRRVERKLRFKREERSVGDKDFDNWL
jgi:hypothetical protein